MTLEPTNLTKKKFINFLKKIDINLDLIERASKLPEEFTFDRNRYFIYIMLISHTDNDNPFEFELNYYCDEISEYLFSLKSSFNLERALNNVECELKLRNIIYL